MKITLASLAFLVLTFCGAVFFSDDSFNDTTVPAVQTPSPFITQWEGALTGGQLPPGSYVPHTNPLDVMSGG